MIRFLIASMLTGLSSVGAMHLPSKVPSPPRCGGKISNGRKQVADIRQGKRVILTSFSLLKRIVILLIFTIFVHVAVFCFSGRVYIEKSFSVKEAHPPSRVNFSQREKKSWPLRPNQELTTALAHALIVLPWPSWPGWATQSVYLLWRKRRVNLPSKKGERTA